MEKNKKFKNCEKCKKPEICQKAGKCILESPPKKGKRKIYNY